MSDLVDDDEDDLIDDDDELFTNRPRFLLLACSSLEVRDFLDDSPIAHPFLLSLPPTSPISIAVPCVCVLLRLGARSVFSPLFPPLSRSLDVVDMDMKPSSFGLLVLMRRLFVPSARIVFVRSVFSLFEFFYVRRLMVLSLLFEEDEKGCC